MNIINLTPHALNIHKQDDSILTIEPSGEIARVGQSREQLPVIDGIEITRSTFGKIENLPEPQADTIYVVSGLVLSRTSRDDVFAPGEAIRNERGQVIGCKGLSAANSQDEITDLIVKLDDETSHTGIPSLLWDIAHWMYGEREAMPNLSEYSEYQRQLLMESAYYRWQSKTK